MPKSRNRKGHKDAVRKRKVRRNDERNRLLNEFKREEKRRLAEIEREAKEMAAQTLSDEEEE